MPRGDQRQRVVVAGDDSVDVAEAVATLRAQGMPLVHALVRRDYVLLKFHRCSRATAPAVQAADAPLR